jgi:phosphoglycerate dehydrogenase-like enzyme
MRLGLLFDREDCDEAVVAQQLADWEVVDLRDWRQRQDELAARCRSVEVLLTGKHSPLLPEELADDPGGLRYICHTRGVVKAYFPRRLLERGLLLTNWGDGAATIADLALTLLLAQLHQVHLRDQLTRGGRTALRWQSYGTGFVGLRIGVYGCGAIGGRFATLCRALGMTVTAFDPWAAALPDGVARAASLDELFAASHAISIHAGLGPSTQASVGATQLAQLCDGGILINTARGGIIDEAALAAEARSGRLLVACDVLADESDWLASPLAAEPAVLLTGHGRHRALPPAGRPPQLWRVPDVALRNLAAYRAGHQLAHRIDAASWDRST